ncbi:MAG: DUF11 domain-containing protein [Spirochaetes bacterium]|nr:DUF11 domain-containing protein [Spirochaetota bacterium]
MVSKHWKKVFSMLVIAIAMVLGTVTVAFAKGTTAGSDILSTNTVVTFENTAAFSMTTNATNALSALSNKVLSVFGASNYTVEYSNMSPSAGTSNYISFIFTNWANSNAQYRSLFWTNWAALGASSAWECILSNFTGNNEIAAAGTTSANIAPDAELELRLHYGIPADAPDGAQLTFMLTNILGENPYGGQAPRTFKYLGTNGIFYGGSNWFTNTVVITVGGPKIIVSKAVTVSAPAAYVTTGGAATDVVPGSVITYTLTYTNAGSGTAQNVVLRDYLPSAVAYFTNTAAGSATPTIVLRNLADSANVTEGTVTAGNVNDTVGHIRFTIPGTIAANAAVGTVTYKVVVK